MSKITVIGAGHVGATIAYTLTVDGTASEVVLIDINRVKARGEAMDIYQGTPFSHQINVYAGDYEDAIGSDIVIITSGFARKAGQSRLDLAQANVDVIKDIAPRIVKYAPNAIYIIVSNPVDILTYVFLKVSGLPKNQVIGSGTMLDTSRLRTCLAAHFGINQKHVHAYVFGEHGDSSMVPWSMAKISNLSLEQYCESVHSDVGKVEMPDFAEVEEKVRKAGAAVIADKGATFYAIAISTCYICNCIFNNNRSILAISGLLEGEYGISDVCLSIPFIVGNRGIVGHMIAPFTPEEKQRLEKSATILKDMIASLKF